VVLWTVGEKTLDKLTDQPGNLIPLDRAGVPDLSTSRDNSDLVEDDCWNLLSAARRPTRVNGGDNRVTCSGAIALFF
jgi:hypothetical protein